MKRLNIVMAGGGTGGHVLPIKSLLQHMDKKMDYKKKINKIFWIGEKNSFEQEACEELKGNLDLDLRFISILSGKYRRETLRKSRMKNIRDMFLFVIGIFQSIYYLLVNRVNVIFCKGGYVALPVVVAGFLLRKKILVHESDVKSGLVNKIASKVAKTTFTGFDGVLKNSITVGQILNEGLLSFDIKDKKDSKTKLLVMGGSQGSKKLYNTLLDLLKKEDFMKNYEITLILGRENKGLKNSFSEFKNVECFDFVDQETMGRLLYESDISLTRAGTTSLAEHKLFGLKIMMVPIPRTHDQYDNAKYYVKKYEDILLDSTNSNYEKVFADTFKKLSGYKKKPVKAGLSEEISKAKDLIIKYMLES